MGPPKADKEQAVDDKLCLGSSLKQSFTQPATSKAGGCTAKNGIWLLLFLSDPLQKGTANHSRIFAWRMPQTGKPGGLQSMGLQRAGHS